MQIQLTGRNIDITDHLREYTNSKFDRLLRHADNITSIQVIFNVEKLRQIAEANVQMPGTNINATAESEDMYHTILELVDKLDRQVSKHIDKQKSKS